MRVHVTKCDVLYGREDLGDFEVVAETTNWYKILLPWFSRVSQEWVPKVDCEVVKIVQRSPVYEYEYGMLRNSGLI